MKKGDRVQYSEEGLRALHKKQRQGTVPTNPGGALISVRWDGNSVSSVDYYSSSYVEKVLCPEY